MARINKPKLLVTQWDVPTSITMRWVCTSHNCLLVKYHCSSEWAVAVLNLYWIHDYTNEILALSRAFCCMGNCTRSMVLEWDISCMNSSLFAWSLSCMIVAYMCYSFPEIHCTYPCMHAVFNCKLLGLRTLIIRLYSYISTTHASSTRKYHKQQMFIATSHEIHYRRQALQLFNSFGKIWQWMTMSTCSYAVICLYSTPMNIKKVWQLQLVAWTTTCHCTLGSIVDLHCPVPSAYEHDYVQVYTTLTIVGSVFLYIHTTLTIVGSVFLYIHQQVRIIRTRIPTLPMNHNLPVVTVLPLSFDWRCCL